MGELSGSPTGMMEGPWIPEGVETADAAPKGGAPTDDMTSAPETPETPETPPRMRTRTTELSEPEMTLI